MSIAKMELRVEAMSLRIKLKDLVKETQDVETAVACNRNNIPGADEYLDTLEEQKDKVRNRLCHVLIVLSRNFGIHEMINEEE